MQQLITILMVKGFPLCGNLPKKATAFLVLLTLLTFQIQAQSTITILSSSDSISICNNTSTCDEMAIPIEAEAITDCTNSNFLIYTYEIDLFNDNIIDSTGCAITVNGLFPIGVHRVIFTIGDACNSIISYDRIVEVKDCLNPVPICFFGIPSANLDTAGEVTIASHLFESGNSFDNCTDYEFLKFSFSTDTNDTLITMNCDSVIQYNGLVPIKLYVTDEAGNYNYCLTFINLIDVNNTCGIISPVPLLTAVTPQSESLSNNKIYYNINNTPALTTGSPDAASVMIGDTITPSEDEDPRNGLSAFDLIFISQHISNTNPFTENWELIAADVDQNGIIDSTDIMIIGNVTNFIVDTFPNNKSWIFEPESIVIDNDILINGFEFTGIKLGDVNGSATAFFTSDKIETRSDGTLDFFIKNKTIEKGKTYTIPTFADNYQDIAGGQFTLDFDTETLDFKSIEAKNLGGFKNRNIGLRFVNEGRILIGWINPNLEEIEDHQAFYNITFTAKNDGQLKDFININSQKIKAEAYLKNNNDYEFLDVTLNFEEETSTSSELSIFPNPFSDKTILTFSLEKEQSVSIQIFDVNGRLIISQQQNGSVGENQFEILQQNLLAKGIYFYQIETDENLWNGKIISQ